MPVMADPDVTRRTCPTDASACKIAFEPAVCSAVPVALLGTINERLESPVPAADGIVTPATVAARFLCSV